MSIPARALPVHAGSRSVWARPQQAARSWPLVRSARTSLVPNTLRELDADPQHSALLQQVAAVGQAALTREERRARQRSLDHLGLPPFYELARAGGGTGALRRREARFLQLNVGLYCNQACAHCHVESSPRRRETMDADTAARCVELLRRSPGVRVLDLTGGAPELQPAFRYLVREAVALGVEVIDRCNLTVLLEPGQEDLAEFLAAARVHVVASLPCYGANNVDAQRGRGVFERSIQGLQQLNALGYGRAGSGLVLDLVYNPGGAFLAPPAAKLEDAYRRELADYGVAFNSLLCLNNMPIKRFADWLLRQGKMEEYMALLVSSFNPAAVRGLMCHDTVSVRWDGALYDCDFNQQLDIPLQLRAPGQAHQRSTPGAWQPPADAAPAPRASGTGQNSTRVARHVSVFDIDSLSALTDARVQCDNHCFGCTAGSGSGCQGATA